MFILIDVMKTVELIQSKLQVKKILLFNGIKDEKGISHRCNRSDWL